MDVPDDPVTASPSATRSKAELRGDAARNLVEVSPAGLEKVEPTFKVCLRQDLALDLRWGVGDAPEIGRPDPGHAFDDLRLVGPGERLGHAGPLRHPGVARPIRHHLLDRS